MIRYTTCLNTDFPRGPAQRDSQDGVLGLLNVTIPFVC
jgi:hypothetical protein